jgi:hypothetical protein
MGVHARRTIEPFTFDKMQQELSDLYDSLAGDNAP